MNPYLPHNYQHPSVSVYNAQRKYLYASKNIFLLRCHKNLHCYEPWSVAVAEVAGWLGGWGGRHLAIRPQWADSGGSAPADREHQELSSFHHRHP